MPQVAAYFAAEYLAAEIAWAAVESFTLDIVGFQAVSAASTFAIAAGTSQLLARNASSLAEQVRGQQINFRSSTAARQMIYGRYLVGGPIVFGLSEEDSSLLGTISSGAPLVDPARLRLRASVASLWCRSWFGSS